MRDQVWKHIVYSSASEFRCRTGSPYDVQRSCCCPCSRHRSVCRSVFWPRRLPRGTAQRRPTAGIGGPARRNRSVAQTTGARADPHRRHCATGSCCGAPVFDSEKRAAIVADVKRQLQTEMGLLPLTLIRDRRQSFVELYSYDDRGGSNYGPRETNPSNLQSFSKTSRDATRRSRRHTAPAGGSCLRR